MDRWEVFLTFGAILSFVGVAYGMFYKPTHELKIEIVKLTSELIAMRKDSDTTNTRVDKNERDIEELKLGHVTLQSSVTYIKERIK